METDRLIIRKFSPEDWKDLHEYLSQPEVVEYEPYGVFTEDESRAEALNRSSSNDFWAVCLKDTKKLIGNIYLSKREFDTWELGYVFNSKYQGKGYATEAAQCLVDDVFRHQAARRVCAMCNPLNQSSWKLLERLNFRREGHLIQNIYFKKDSFGNPIWQDTYEYAILALEWLQFKLCSFEKVMIIIAGMPASGKTAFAEWLSDKIQIPLVCKDKLKEVIWDKVHYDTAIRGESQKYGGLAYDLSFHFCDILMKRGMGFIFESNFVEPFPEIMSSKVSLYGYKTITVLFDGDVKEIHRRFIERDVTDERHPGLVSDYFNDFEVFKNATQRCRTFSYGDIRITVDSTDFSKINYDEIADKISANI